jgi:TolB-like protein
MNFRFTEFEIDAARQELRRGGATVHLEPQVFAVLLHLVRHRDRVVSRDELIEEIWQGRVISDAALSSRINAARRALGDSGAKQDFIRTTHKRGFRFVSDVLEISPDAAPPIAVTTADVEHAFVEAAHSEIAVPAPAMRPAVAVLPFDNLGGDIGDDYFCYGMMEDMIRLLGRYRWLTVISRHSTVAFKGPEYDVRKVGEALGVRYVVVGSVRRSPGAVRITAELVSADDGVQLWSETYDLPLDDIFDIQEEMARQIAATIEPELAKFEQQLAARKTPENLDAWDCFQRGLWHLWAFTAPGFDTAEAFFRRAIEIDPEFARAHGALGYVDVQRALYDTPDVRDGRLASALAAGKTAVALDERDCFCHCVVGRALCFLRRNVEATAALDLTLELNPSFAQGFFAQGFNKLWSGRPEEAEALLDRATLLSPHDSHLWSFHHVRALAHFSLGEFETAAEFARRAARLPNATYRAFATLTSSLGNLPAGEERGTAAAELRQRKPNYTGALARQEFFFTSDEDFFARFIGGLRKAGIPAR